MANDKALIAVCSCSTYKINNAVSNRFRSEGQLLDNLKEKLRLLDPVNILSRGFTAVTNDDGQMLHSVNDLKKGQEYKLHLMDGDVKIRIV